MKPDDKLFYRGLGMRHIVTGVPRSGKTTLAPTARHTDDLISLGWSPASARACEWMDEPGPWVIEGVTAVRALRKWLAQNTSGKPCDSVLWLDSAHVPLTEGQHVMAKGMRTIWREIMPELVLRGVQVLEQ